MPGFKRLPNQYGTITKLSGKRRKPYCARKYAGEVWDDAHKKYNYRYVSVGTFSTRREALDALAAANKNENFSRENVTFGYIADLWLREKKSSVSDSLYRGYKSAVGKLSPLNKKKIRDLKTDDFERIINSDDIPRTTKGKCKIVLNGIYDYALRHEYVEKDYSRLVRINADQKAQINRQVFTPDEVQDIWDCNRSVVEDVVIVMLYTGLRISEALAIKLDNIDLENHLLVGVGMKTDAGKNRTIPIHDDIYPLIEEYASVSSKKAPYALFTIDGRRITANQFAGRFRVLFPSHTSHDCRHSFATYAYKARMDATMVKLIMGHAVGDITKGRYTHITSDDLRSEMNKYEIK